MKMARIAALIVLAGLAALGVAPGAQATTFCVPTVSACPSGGTAKADLEEALGSNAEDGQADTVYVAAGTYTEDADFEPEPGSSDPITFEVDGNDDLTVIGAGPGATILTSAGSKNAYVVNLSYNNGRDVTMRNLGIEVPPSFPDNQGAAILLFQGDVLENVSVVSFNDESNGVRSSGNGNRILGGIIRGGGLEGTLRDGISSEYGEAVAKGVDIVGATWALTTGSAASSRLVARRIHETGTRNYGAIASSGSIRVENSIFELDDGIGLYASAAADDTTLEADHLTVVNFGATYPALEGKKFSATAGDVTLIASNSIFRGFSSGYKMESPFGPGIGLVKVTARYSNIPSNGVDAGGTEDFGTGVIDADPLFADDYSLLAGSPSIDAGDPSIGLNDDFLGAARPVDGNGDGAVVRDQGAYEYQPTPPPGGGSSSGGGDSVNPLNRSKDVTPPDTFIAKDLGKALSRGTVKLRFRSSERGSTFVCKLDKRKIRPCKSPKAYTGLKPGRHLFKAWAIDKAGNKDPTPAKKRFRIPAKFSER